MTDLNMLLSGFRERMTDSEEHTSSIFRQSSNPVSGFSMMEQALCCLAHGEQALLFREPLTGLDE